MNTAAILIIIASAALVTLPAFAQVSEVSVNVTGGSEASQSCVSAKNCYDPDIVTIQPKTTVWWTNIDSTAHTVTSGEPSGSDTGKIFDSGEIGPGATYSFIFMSPGSYNYFCTIHPWMTGQIIVGSEVSSISNSTAGSSATTPEFGPAAVLVFVASIVMVVLLARRTLNFGYQ